MNLIDQNISVISKLCESHKVNYLYAFGSILTNKFSEKSDVDLIVDFDRPIGLAFVSLADELEKILNKKVDLATEGGIKPRYMPYVQKDLIYV